MDAARAMSKARVELWVGIIDRPRGRGVRRGPSRRTAPGRLGSAHLVTYRPITWGGGGAAPCAELLAVQAKTSSSVEKLMM